MEAIKIESKKTQPKTNKKTLADFAGKMNSNINWIAYQKKIRNEWTKVLPDINAVGLYLDDGKFRTKYLSPDFTISISTITQLEYLHTLKFI